ncbi:MAG: hypothetical protein GY804_04840 [Alphaproteobacteria bacterium]|nr:hypothetical protein [Alphaproteobacteria bacterium]
MVGYIQGFMKAIAQLLDKDTRKIIWKSVFITVVAYIVMSAGVYYGVSKVDYSAEYWKYASVLGGFLAVVLSFVLFPTLCMLVSTFFLEEVAEAVEKKYLYPIMDIRRQSFNEIVMTGLKFAGISLVLNILALPFYFIPVLNVLVIYSLNGYLVGREYFEIVALRKIDAEETAVLRKSCGKQLMLAGAFVAFLMTIPFVNFVAPIIGIAFMVHKFESIRENLQSLIIDQEK